MSVSLREMLEHSGYKIEDYEDAVWFLSKQTEIEQLIAEAEQTVEDYEDDHINPEKLYSKAEELRDSLREDGINV